MDDKERDQLFKADASDEGCLNLHLLITQMESVRFPYDEDGLGTDSAIYLQLYLTGQGGQKIIEGIKKKSAKDETRFLYHIHKEMAFGFSIQTTEFLLIDSWQNRCLD